MGIGQTYLTGMGTIYQGREVRVPALEVYGVPAEADVKTLAPPLAESLVLHRFQHLGAILVVSIRPGCRWGDAPHAPSDLVAHEHLRRVIRIARYGSCIKICTYVISA